MAASQTALADCDPYVDYTSSGCDIYSSTESFLFTQYADITNSGVRIYDEGHDADITNLGSIHSDEAYYIGSSTYIRSAIFANDDFAGQIKNSGIISASQTSGFDDDYGTLSTIYIDGDLESIGLIDNSGDIRTTANINYNESYNNVSAYGIHITDDIVGTISNSGEISTSVKGHGDSVKANSIYVEDHLYGNINNSGNITTDATNLNLAGPSSILNYGSAFANEYGSAYAEATGIAIADEIKGSIENTGNIETNARSTGQLAGTHAVGISTENTMLGDIFNLGDIESTARSTTVSAPTIYDSYESSSNYGYAYSYGDAYAEGISVNGEGLDGTLTNDGNIKANAIASTNQTRNQQQSLLNNSNVTDDITEFTFTLANSKATAVTIDGALNGDLINNQSITAIAETNGQSDITAYAYGSAYSSINNNTSSDYSSFGNFAIDYMVSNASATGVAIHGGLNGSLSNSGNISANADTDVDMTIQVYSEAYSESYASNGYGYGSSASSDSDAYAFAYGIAFANANAIGINVSNGYELETMQAFNVSNEYESATNYGVITNDGSINAEATFNGRFNAVSFAHAESYANENSYGYGYNSTASANAESGSFAYVGTQVSANAYGILVESNFYGDITNNDTITATASLTTDAYAYAYESESTGGNASSYSDAYGEAYAVSYGNAYASAISINDTLFGSINNNANLIASATAEGNNDYDDNSTVSTAVEATATGIRTGNVEGSINNSGIITANANANYQNENADSYAYGIDSNDIGEYGSITNDNAIIANADAYDDAYSYGISASTVNGQIENHGNIETYANSSDDDAYAYGIKTDDIGEYGSITNDNVIIANADAYDDAYSYGISSSTVYGSILNNVEITASATSSAADDSYAYAYGINSDGVYGSITNNGTLNISASTIDEDADAYGIESSTVYGSITNNGTLNISSTSSGDDAYAYGIDSSNVYGSITNNGTLNISSTGSGDDAYAYGIESSNVYGSVINNSDMNISATTTEEDDAEATGIESSDVYGSIVNNSTINIYSSAAGEDAYSFGIESDSVYGNITNNEAINVTATSSNDDAYAYGIESSTVYGSITNNNSINVSATAGIDGDEATAAGIDTSDVYGSITNYGSISISASSASDDGYAYGITTNQIHEGGVIANFNSINVESTVTDDGYYAEAYGIDSGDVYGSIINEGGDINVNATQSGTYGASAWGIYASNVYDGSISNSGVIAVSAEQPTSADAYARGITTGSLYGSISNAENGDINATATSAEATSYAAGIDVYSIGTDSAIHNEGDISANAYSTSENSSTSYAYAAGITARETNNGTIQNDGSILASAESNADYASATGIYVNNQYNSGSIVNNGVIVAGAQSASGSNAYASGITANTNYGSISNSGQIFVVADAAEGSAESYGIYTDYMGSTGSIYNDGEIFVGSNSNEESTNEAYGIYVASASYGSTITNDGFIGVDASGGLSASNNQLYSVYVEGEVDITNNGTLVGAVHTQGNLFSGEGSNFTMVVQNPVASSNYNSYVEGTADFTGSSFSVLATPDNTVDDAAVFTDIISAGDIIVDDAQLTAIDDNLFLYDFTLVWDAEDANATDDDSLDLVVNRSTIHSPVDDMYDDIAKALESMYQAGNNCDPASVECNNIHVLIEKIDQAKNIEELRALLANAGPAFGGQTAYQAARNQGAVNQAILARLGAGGLASGDSFLDGSKVWAKVIHTDSQRDEENNHSGYESENTGIIIGADAGLTETIRLGAALALTKGEMEGVGRIRGQKGDMDSAQVIAYANFDLAEYGFVDAQFSVGSGTNTMKLKGMPDVEYDTQLVNLRGDYGMHFTLSDALTITPVASLNLMNIDEDDYTLSGTKHEADHTAAELGLDGNIAWAITSQVKLTGLVGLAHDLEGDKSEADSSFISGYTYETVADQQALAVKGGIGVEFTPMERTNISVNYEIMNRGEFESDTLSAKVDYTF